MLLLERDGHGREAGALAEPPELPAQRADLARHDAQPLPQRLGLGLRARSGEAPQETASPPPGGIGAALVDSSRGLSAGAPWVESAVGFRPLLPPATRATAMTPASRAAAAPARNGCRGIAKRRLRGKPSRTRPSRRA